MTTACQQLSARFTGVKISASKYDDQANTIRKNLYGSTDPIAIQYGMELLSLKADAIQSLNGELQLILSLAKENGCDMEVFQDVAYSISESLDYYTDLVGELAVSLQKQLISAKDQQQQTTQSTTSTNNAGTGTPGTAGTGPGATQPTTDPTVIDDPNAGDPIESGAMLIEPQAVTDPTGVVFDEPTTPDLEADTGATDPTNTNLGLFGDVESARAQASLQDTTNFKQVEDWRVRLSLSPGATYLYKAEDKGILAPLAATDGVIFPYTPDIQINYAAMYDTTNLIHSNYKIFQYQSSGVDQISITCDFTAQDTFEANYLLAVIHFFRSVTKMFYGQDKYPKPGTPPPLCYLFGLGQFQFNAHPLVIANFNYTLPSDVDYIRAGKTTTTGGVNKDPASIPNNASASTISRLIGKIVPGGYPKPTNFNTAPIPMTVEEPTYVPTKIQIQLTAYPIVSRNEISNNFSVEQYATGKLLNGTKRSGGGFW